MKSSKTGSPLLIKIVRESLWWIISLLVVWLLLKPVTDLIHYKFYWANFAYVIIFITYFRYIIFFKDVLIFRNKWTRLIIFLLNIYLFALVLLKFQEISNVFSSYQIKAFANHLKDEITIVKEAQLLKYLKCEIYLSGIGSMVLILALNMKILFSFFTGKIHRLN